METLVNRYHVGSAVSKSRASKVFLGDPHFIEILGFLTYLHDSEGYSFEELSKKVVFVTKSHAFIFASGAIYHADPDSKKFSQIYPISNNEGICFISARESFYHPFFLLVEWLWEQSWDIDIRGVNIGNKKLKKIWPYKDKIHIMSRLFHTVDEVTGDFVVPYHLWGDTDMIKSILDFTQNHLGRDVMIKKNFGCAGESLRAVRLDRMNKDTLQNVIRDYFSPTGNFWGTYITPFYDIDKEYRMYYLFDGEESTIYSIKGRKNTLSRKKIFDQVDFRIYKSIPVKWSYLGKNIKELEWEKFQQMVDKIIKSISYTTWILEVIRTKDWKYRIMEVNYLGSSLAFPGEDVTNMTQYNIDMFQNLFK